MVNERVATQIAPLPAIEIDLRLARHFVVLAEEGSFSAAAERLYLGQPALSKQIRILERCIGSDVRLIDRSRRPWILTRTGHEFLAVCHELLTTATWHSVNK